MRLACVFPGQGSQSTGMLNSLAEQFPLVRRTFDEASDVLQEDLWKLTREGNEDELNITSNTQPVMLCAGVSVWRIWQENGGSRPEVMAGHSFGEYTALVCSQSIAFKDAIQVARLRGQLMQAAVPEGQGAMAAILGLEDDQVIEICLQAAQGEVVQAVNFNAPSQVVIAGHSAAVERGMALAKEVGAKRAIRLPVSVPAHCKLMVDAAAKLAEYLTQISVSMPDIPVIQNADVQSYIEPAEIIDGLQRQLFSPVRWVETIQAMSSAGVETVIEMGPGKVLTNLGKRIDKSLTQLCVHDPESLAQALEL